MNVTNAKLSGQRAEEQALPLGERRQTARFLLRNVCGSMTWQGEAGDTTCNVSVLNISGGGAAVLADDAPQAGQTLRLRLHCESARMDPVDAQVLDTSMDSSGRQVLHMRFARWIPLDSLLEGYRERRLWERYPARESRATLNWFEGATEKTVQGDLLNISGGGAAFVSDILPPPGVAIWLQLEASVWQVDRFDPVESKLVTTSEDPSGMKVAHIQFLDPCPMDVFEFAVNGSE